MQEKGSRLLAPVGELVPVAQLGHALPGALAGRAQQLEDVQQLLQLAVPREQRHLRAAVPFIIQGFCAWILPLSALWEGHDFLLFQATKQDTQAASSSKISMGPHLACLWQGSSVAADLSA
jgi:hypothetical protein